VSTYALVIGDVVQNVVHGKRPPGPRWVACPRHARAGDSFDGSTLTRKRPPPPDQVTRLQARLVLIDAAIWPAVEAWFAAPERTQGETAFWQDALVWRRTDPVLRAAADALGILPAEVDDLFRLAARK